MKERERTGNDYINNYFLLRFEKRFRNHQAGKICQYDQPCHVKLKWIYHIPVGVTASLCSLHAAYIHKISQHNYLYSHWRCKNHNDAVNDCLTFPPNSSSIMKQRIKINTHKFHMLVLTFNKMIFASFRTI